MPPCADVHDHVHTDRQTDLPPSADVTVTVTHNSVNTGSVSAVGVIVTSRDTVLRHDYVTPRLATVLNLTEHVYICF